MQLKEKCIFLFLFLFRVCVYFNCANRISIWKSTCSWKYTTDRKHAHVLLHINLQLCWRFCALCFDFDWITRCCNARRSHELQIQLVCVVLIQKSVVALWLFRYSVIFLFCLIRLVRGILFDFSENSVRIWSVQWGRMPTIHLPT